MQIPALGITGTGGAGKSLADRRTGAPLPPRQGDTLKLAIVSIDPSRKRTGGALLGDRIRMNAIEHPNIYMRSLATRDTGSEISAALPEVIAACKLGRLRSGHRRDLRHRPGRRGDRALRRRLALRDDPEFGAASQLEKIDMLDFADFVAINKFDRKGADDALRACASSTSATARCSARRPTRCRCSAPRRAFNDDSVTALYQALPPLAEFGLKFAVERPLPLVTVKRPPEGAHHRPADRALPRRDRRDGAFVPQTTPPSSRRRSPRAPVAATSKACSRAAARPHDFDELIDWKDGEQDPMAKAARHVAGHAVKAYAATSTW